MDEKMMKAGGAQKRAELIKAFGELSISTTKTRELTKFENQIKEIKYHLYKTGWFMRGFVSYQDLMYTLGREDINILQDIIKENLEATKESGMPFF